MRSPLQERRRTRPSGLSYRPKQRPIGKVAYSLSIRVGRSCALNRNTLPQLHPRGQTQTTATSPFWTHYYPCGEQPPLFYTTKGKVLLFRIVDKRPALPRIKVLPQPKRSAI